MAAEVCDQFMVIGWSEHLSDTAQFEFISQ